MHQLLTILSAVIPLSWQTDRYGIIMSNLLQLNLCLGKLTRKMHIPSRDKPLLRLQRLHVTAPSLGDQASSLSRTCFFRGLGLFCTRWCSCRTYSLRSLAFCVGVRPFFLIFFIATFSFVSLSPARTTLPLAPAP